MKSFSFTTSTTYHRHSLFASGNLAIVIVDLVSNERDLFATNRFIGLEQLLEIQVLVQIAVRLDLELGEYATLALFYNTATEVTTRARESILEPNGLTLVK